MEKTLTQKRVIKHGWNKVSVITADMIQKHGYTQIGDYAFYDCRSLTSITLPNSITRIGCCAFRYCTNLTSITIPNSVTSIGKWAFYDCHSLTSITIPNSVTSIGDGAFEFCTSLTSITIPNSVTAIGDNAFYGCRSLTSITIPNSVTNIGNFAFTNCSNLASITIPDSVTRIGKWAFSWCRSLTTIIIPNSVTTIDFGAFYLCGIKLPKHYDDKGRLIAYKGFDKDMQCYNDFQYVEGETYETNKAVLCECGFHACTNPLDVFRYYSGEINKAIYIHEVYLEEVSDEENEFDSKIVAKKITIGKRLTIEDINRIIQEK